jgi:ribose 5-phosphate isomerase A
MKMALTADEMKKAAATVALDYIKPGMTVGLGTGSTAKHFVDGLAERVKGGLNVTCVATSQVTAEHAKSVGLTLKSLHDAPFIDVTVDGADEFDPQLRLIKGGGGALLIEKIVASSSRYMIVIADESKRVDALGKFPLPVEVVPVAVSATAWKIERAYDANKMKIKMVVRGGGKDGKAFRTDVGNVIVDCWVEGGVITDPDRLDIMLNNIPGVVNNGLFIGICGQVLVGTQTGVTSLEKQ